MPAVTARGLSPTERLWLAADEVARATAATPFVIEVYALGAGVPDPAALETASEGLVRAWPLAGARLERGQWRQHHARLPVRVTLAQPDAEDSDVLEGEGELVSEPVKDVVCVALGVAEPEEQPELDSVGECDAVEDTLGEEEGAPEGEGAADAEALSEAELEKLPEPEGEPDAVLGPVPLGSIYWCLTAPKPKLGTLQPIRFQARRSIAIGSPMASRRWVQNSPKTPFLVKPVSG